MRNVEPPRNVRKAEKDIVANSKKVTRKEIRTIMKEAMAELLKDNMEKIVRSHPNFSSIVQAGLDRYINSTTFKYDVERSLALDRERARKVVEDVAINMAMEGKLGGQKKKPQAAPKARRVKF